MDWIFTYESKPSGLWKCGKGGKRSYRFPGFPHFHNLPFGSGRALEVGEHGVSGALQSQCGVGVGEGAGGALQGSESAALA